MRIAHLLNENNVSFEERKRALQRREMSETYKKNASFVKASKNPVLEMLENLLSGKTEKELHENISLTSEDAHFSEEKIPTIEEIENHLEQVITIGSEPIDPSPEDLQVVSSTLTQNQQMTSQIASESDFDLNDEEPFANERFDFTLPERFTKDFDWKVNQKTVFGKDLESLIFRRTYNKAVSKYTLHMQMAENGFLMDGPRLTLTA